jgi:RNA polymerase sigma-70 factor, ECF subfamily
MDTSPDSLDFQAVHDRYRPRVLRYLTRLVGAGEAEDLTQSVMLKVSSSLAGFRGESNLSTWIYRIASNTAVDLLRRKATQLPIDPDIEVEDAGDAAALRSPSLEESAAREEMNACVREFIAKLPTNYRTVMVLSELEGFSNEEIANVLGLTVGTVKIRLHRARDKLRSELSDGCSFDHGHDGELGCDRKPVASAPVILTRRR